MKKKVEIKAEVVETHGRQVEFEFGRTQGDMWISNRGTIQRKLRLEEGDKVKITIEKV